MVDKFLTNKSQQNIFQKKENIFHQPRAEIHLNYYERPELEIIDNNPSGSSFLNSDKNLNYSTISLDKKQSSYASIHLRKIQENKQDSKYIVNMDNQMSFDYSTQFSSPGKPNSSKPPLPRPMLTNGKQSRKNQANQLSNYSNYTPINKSSDIIKEENHYSKIQMPGSNQVSQEQKNVYNTIKRENNFSSNDHNTSRRSNSNNSRKSNTNTSISSVNGYLEKRHMETQQRVNRLKMEKMKKEQDELRPVPHISENSKKIAEGLFNSGDVIDRLTYSKFEKKAPFTKKNNSIEANKSQDVNKIEKILNEMKKANKELQANANSISSTSIVKYGNEEKSLANQSVELNKKNSNTSGRKINEEFGTPKSGRQKISNSIDRKKEYSNSIKKSFQPIKLKRESRDGSLNKSIEKKNTPNKSLVLMEKKSPIKERSYNDVQDSQKDKLLNVRKSLHEYLSSRPRTNQEDIRRQIPSPSHLIQSNDGMKELKYYETKNHDFKFQYNNSNVNNLMNYIEDNKTSQNNHNNYLLHDHDYDSVKALYPFNHIPHSHPQDYHIQSALNPPINKEYDKKMHSPYQPVSYSVNLSSIDSLNLNPDLKSKAYIKGQFDYQRISSKLKLNIEPNDSSNLLSNEEVYSIVKSDTKISEERKNYINKEKIRILEEEMLKITKLNGLKLQEPPSPSEYKRKINLASNPKFNNYQNNLNIAMERESENSVEYHNINTSYSETQKNVQQKLEYNSVNNSQKFVNSSYNFKNPLIAKKMPIEGGNTTNSDSEKLEKCLDNTNEKLRNLNYAKQTLNSKMEFSFRDVSKFLKN